jgi:hypothetical protein
MGAGARCHEVAAALERLADRRAGVIGRLVQAAAWGLARPFEWAPEDLATRFECAAVNPENAWWTAHRVAEAWLDWAGAAEVRQREAAALSHLLREVIRSPAVSPKTLPSHVTAWHDRTVPRLAEAAYDERRLPEGTLDPARLGILADALLDAGCDDEELLAHLRSTGPHVRGCHAVDAVLGRQ